MTETRPVLGLAPSGMYHASDGSQIGKDGWAPALCRKSLWVSVEHESYIDPDTGKWQTVPLLAFADGAPHVTEDGVHIGDVPGCLRCVKVLHKMEATGQSPRPKRTGLGNGARSRGQ